MPQIDPERLILIVAGVDLTAELGDRPLAYRIQEQSREILAGLLGATPPGSPPVLAPAVVSDVYYLNHQPLQDRPMLSIGGPGVNAVSALMVEKLPTVLAIENTLVVQLDLEWQDLRAAVWGMNHVQTVQAVDLFISRGYLRQWLEAVVRQSSQGKPGV